ncbi:MAG: hypothetical protein AAF574_14405 [Pseudomonadota bacterium]
MVIVVAVVFVAVVMLVFISVAVVTMMVLMLVGVAVITVMMFVLIGMAVVTVVMLMLIGMAVFAMMVVVLVGVTVIDVRVRFCFGFVVFGTDDAGREQQGGGRRGRDNQEAGHSAHSKLVLVMRVMIRPAAQSCQSRLAEVCGAAEFELTGVIL